MPGADAPELEAVAVGRHAGEHGHQGPRHGHGVGAGEHVVPPGPPAAEGEAAQMTWARATVTALSALTRTPRQLRVALLGGQVHHAETARLSSQ